MIESVGVGALNGSGAAPVPSSVLEIPWYVVTGRSGRRWVTAERPASENVGERATGRSMSNSRPRRLMRRAARLYHDARTSSARTWVELDDGEDEGVCMPERGWRWCLRRRRLTRHQTVTAVTRTAITPTPTAIPAIAPALRPVFDTLNVLALGVGDPEAVEAETPPPLPVAVGLPDEDPDTDGRQLVFGPASTVTGGSPLESPSASVMSNCRRVPEVKLAVQDMDAVAIPMYDCNCAGSELLSALSGEIFSL